MIETEMSPRLTFIMLCIYLMLMWRWRTTAKIMDQYQKMLIVGILLPFALFIGAITGAWQTAGIEAANRIIPDWIQIMAVFVSAMLAPYFMLIVLSTLGGFINFIYRIMTTPAQKEKNTPQNIGDFDRLSIKDDEHQEDNYRTGQLAAGEMSQ